MKPATLLILILLLASCRTIQKNRSSADSTAVRSEARTEAYTREIVTEYEPGSIPLSGSRLSLGLDAPQVYTPLVHYVPGPQKILRQTIRETGQKQESKAEQKTASVQVSETQKDYSPVIEKALLLFTVFLVLMGVAVLAGVGLVLVRRR